MLKNLIVAVFTCFAFFDFASAATSQDIEKEFTISGPNDQGEYIIDWLINYENTSGSTISQPAYSEIIDTFSANQTLVAGSINTPNGWSSSNSGASVTFQSNLDIPPEGNIVHSNDFPGINNHLENITATGDGYKPIPYYPDLLTKKIYVINHHASAVNPSFHCYDLNATTPTKRCTAITGAWPRRLPDGNPSTPDLEIDPTTSTIIYNTSPTSNANEEFQIYKDKLYYAVTTYGKWGMGCFDLQTEQECGFTHFATDPDIGASFPNGKFPIGVEGPFIVNDKAYLLDVEMNIHCIQLASNPCQSSPISVKNAGSNNLLHNLVTPNGKEGQIAGRIYEDRIFFTVEYSSNQPGGQARKDALCFDTVTNAICSGWAGANTFIGYSSALSGRTDNWGNYLYYSFDSATNTASAIAICTRSKTTQSCLDVSDGNAVSLTDVYTGTSSFGLGGEVVSNDGRKTYFPHFFSGVVSCFNWETGLSCAAPTASDIPSGARVYAGAKDKYGCYWFNGDANKLWSMDPTTASSPCNFMSFGDSFEAPQQCSGKPRDLLLKVNNVTVGDFGRLELKVSQAGSTPVSVDLTDPNNVDYSLALTSSEVSYTVIATHANGVQSYTSMPSITIIDQSKTEFCFQTKFQCDNIAGSIVNNTVNVWKNGESTYGDQDIVETQMPCDNSNPCLEFSAELATCRGGQPHGAITFDWDKIGSQGKNIEFSAISPAGITPNPLTSYTLPSNAGTETLYIHPTNIPAGSTSMTISGDYSIPDPNVPGKSSCCSFSNEVALPSCWIEENPSTTPKCDIQIGRSETNSVPILGVSNVPSGWIAKIENVSPATAVFKINGTPVTQFDSSQSFPFDLAITGSLGGGASANVSFDIVIYSSSNPEEPICITPIRKTLNFTSPKVVFPENMDSLPYSTSKTCAIGISKINSSSLSLNNVNLLPYWFAQITNVFPAYATVSPTVFNSNATLPLVISTTNIPGVEFDLYLGDSYQNYCKHRLSIGIVRGPMSLPAILYLLSDDRLGSGNDVGVDNTDNGAGNLD